MATRGLEDLTGKTSYNQWWMLPLQLQNSFLTSSRYCISVPGEGSALGRVCFPWAVSRPWPFIHQMALCEHCACSLQYPLNSWGCFHPEDGQLFPKLKVLCGESLNHFPYSEVILKQNKHQTQKNNQKTPAFLNPSKNLNVRTPTGAQLTSLWCYYIVPVTNPTHEVGWSGSSWLKMFSRRTF